MEIANQDLLDFKMSGRTNRCDDCGKYFPINKLGHGAICDHIMNYNDIYEDVCEDYVILCERCAK